MKKQYVITFENPRRKGYGTHYLTHIVNRYPFQTTDINQAATFGTKAEARNAIRGIRKDDLYNTDVDVVLK